MGSNEGMTSLVQKVNKLQDLVCEVGEGLEGLRLQLPQIVVVGSQSVGKSSVLESIVGQEFIPRGTDIVTRCPLYLQLIKNSETYGEFLHLPGKKFFDFSFLTAEIERQTEHLAGKDGISSEPITLKLYSNKVLDLTLVDLPGLVKIALKGQPENISQQIRDIVLKYIKPANALILAVSAATEDLANSAALKLAAQVDPAKRRTIGVLTKLDLIGEEQVDRVKDILNNKFYPLTLGHIGVVNRSPEDIRENRSVDDTLEDENEFFDRNSVFKSVRSRVGTKNLQQSLNTQLANHIRDIIPGFRNSIQDQLRKITEELDKYGEEEIDSDNLAVKLNKLLCQLQDQYSREIGRGGSTDIGWDKLSSGARMNYALNRIYPNEILNMSEEEAFSQKIATVIINHCGIHLGTFIPDEAFHAIIKKEIERFLAPSLNVVDVISKEMQKLIDECIECMKVYPRLRDSVDFELKGHIRCALKVTADKITELIEIESSYINTNHKDFKQIDDHLRKTRIASDTEVRLEDILSPEGDAKREDDTFSSNSLESSTRKGFLGFGGKGKGRLMSRPDLTAIEKTESVSSKPSTTGEFLNGEIVSNGQSALNGLETVPLPAPNTVPDLDNMDSYLISEMKASPSVKIMQDMASSYIQIVQTTLIDYIPKLVMHCMVNSTKVYMEQKLSVNILKQNDVGNLLARSKDEQRFVELLHKKKAVCEEAIKTLADI